MAKFSLYILANPFNGQGHLTAIRFADAVLAAGHQLVSVFFSSDAVLVGHLNNDPASDEPNPQAWWQAIAERSGCELLLCSSACQKRGLSQTPQAGQSNLANAFVIAGLGSLVEASIDVDRVIQFPG